MAARHSIFYLILLLFACQKVLAQQFASQTRSNSLAAPLLANTEKSAAQQITSIPFNRAGNLILIKGRADSTEGNFVLDTGAPGLVLNLTYFRQYHTTHAEARGSVTGEVPDAQQTIISSFHFGNETFVNQSADLVSLGHIEDRKGVKILGLIGVSFFTKSELIIDYEKSLLYISKNKNKNAPKSYMLADTSTYTIVPIDLIENKIIAYTKMGNRKLKFIVDTGAESNVLDSRLPNKIFENVIINRRTQIVGAGQRKIDALYGQLQNMTIGNKGIGTLPVLITNLENACISSICCVDGLLGFDFLSMHKIGFNFARSEMYIWK
jgi:predicted aspartyl protease